MTSLAQELRRAAAGQALRRWHQLEDAAFFRRTAREPMGFGQRLRFFEYFAAARVYTAHYAMMRVRTAHDAARWGAGLL